MISAGDLNDRREWITRFELNRNKKRVLRTPAELA